MDWQALQISLELAFWTSVLLFPVGIFLGRALAVRQLPFRPFYQSLIFLPLGMHLPYWGTIFLLS